MQKNILIGAVVVIIFGLGIWFVAQQSTGRKTKTNTNTVATNQPGATQVSQELKVSDKEFTPASFTTGAGVTIKIKLTNSGTTAHSLSFSKLDFSSPMVDPGQSSVITLTTPAAPGTYDFQSVVGKNKEAGLTGKMVVTK